MCRECTRHFVAGILVNEVYIISVDLPHPRPSTRHPLLLHSTPPAPPPVCPHHSIARNGDHVQILTSAPSPFPLYSQHPPCILSSSTLPSPSPQSIHTTLRNGDRVQILTSDSVTPDPDWERMVKSGRARAEIRRVVRAGCKDNGKELGTGGKADVPGAGMGGEASGAGTGNKDDGKEARGEARSRGGGTAGMGWGAVAVGGAAAAGTDVMAGAAAAGAASGGPMKQSNPSPEASPSASLPGGASKAASPSGGASAAPFDSSAAAPPPAAPPGQAGHVPGRAPDRPGHVRRHVHVPGQLPGGHVQGHVQGRIPDPGPPAAGAPPGQEGPAPGTIPKGGAEATAGRPVSIPEWGPSAGVLRRRAVRLRVAGCCGPVPGDPVFGMLHPSGDIFVHRDCCRRRMQGVAVGKTGGGAAAGSAGWAGEAAGIPGAGRQLVGRSGRTGFSTDGAAAPSRVEPVVVSLGDEWFSASGSLYSTRLNLSLNGSSCSLAAICAEVERGGAAVAACRLSRRRAGADKAGLTLEVQDLLQLLLVVRALRTLPGVSAVERV